MKLGDNVWISLFQTHAPAYIECPDCGGTGRIRLIMYDNSEHSIACGNCSSGYNPPTGRVLVYQTKAAAFEGEIIGIDIREGSTEYRIEAFVEGSYRTYIYDQSEIFQCEKDALAFAEKEHFEYIKKQKESIYKKEKDTRSWAWHVSYYRNKIKEAQKNIEYYTAKLTAANLKQKEEKP